MRNFCTYFDKNYLIQGLTLYKSLCDHCNSFHLYIVALDGLTFDIIKKMAYRNITVIPLADIEDEEVLKAKERANSWQYVGVIQPVVCEYILRAFCLDSLTYLEADMFFFSSPEILFDELKGKYVSLVPHRFSKEHERSKESGRYCTQFNSFYNNQNSYEILDYWKQESFKYSKDKPNDYPGQLSIDNWISMFEDVLEIENIRARVAPWNIDNYKLDISQDGVPSVNGKSVVFYHFHQFGWLANGKYHYCSYELPKNAIECFYKPYTKVLKDVEQHINAICEEFDYRKVIFPASFIKRFLKRLLPVKLLRKISHLK
jgi:hypothetical protein